MSNGSELKSSFGIRKATLEDLKLIDSQKELFQIKHPKYLNLASKHNNTTTFLAVDPKGQVNGFVTALIEEANVGRILCLYTRKGFERNGIASKLLGKANAFFIRKKIPFARVWSTEEAMLFYKKHSNYRPQTGMLINPAAFEAKLKSNPRKRLKVRVKPKVLSPQNRMNPLKLRRRR